MVAATDDTTYNRPGNNKDSNGQAKLDPFAQRFLCGTRGISEARS
jgi:hypothetical protein